MKTSTNKQTKSSIRVKKTGTSVVSSSPVTAVVSNRAYVYLENSIKSIDISHMGEHFTVTLPIRKLILPSLVHSKRGKGR